MKVLVACEFSGRVREAFRHAGHDAVSVDLLPSELPGPHIVGDAIEAIYTFKPDLLIAHPPCTYLANSGVRWLYRRGTADRVLDRWDAMEAAADFFAAFLAAPVARVAVENPVMHKHGREAIDASMIAVYDRIQTVQPWWFGHGETKATQLWLRNLPPLTPTNLVDGREPVVHRMPPSADRWKARSRTYQGLADAMAAQWGVE